MLPGGHNGGGRLTGPSAYFRDQLILPVVHLGVPRRCVLSRTRIQSITLWPTRPFKKRFRTHLMISFFHLPELKQTSIETWH